MNNDKNLVSIIEIIEINNGFLKYLNNRVLLLRRIVERNGILITQETIFIK